MTTHSRLPCITDFLDRADPNCPACLGDGLVCENHPDKAWEQPTGCGCGAGAPCRCTERTPS